MWFLNDSVLNRSVSPVFILVMRPPCALNEASSLLQVASNHDRKNTQGRQTEAEVVTLAFAGLI